MHFVYGTFKRKDFKEMLDWMIVNRNKGYFVNLREFHVNDMDIEAYHSYDTPLQTAILADLKTICEDKEHFPVLTVIGLINNHYRSHYAFGYYTDSLFSELLRNARSASTGVTVSAYTDTSYQYPNMCGTLEDSYHYYDLSNSDEVSKCRSTWHWELKDNQRRYGDAGPFPNKHSNNVCPTSYNECWSTRPVSNYRTSLTISSNKCNEESVTVLDLSKYPKLKSVTIGDESFMYVNEVIITGLNELESVVIGNNSFTMMKNSFGNNSTRAFLLSNCPKMKSLKIGDYSFSDYSAFLTQGIPSAETIQIGDFSFISASFGLRSESGVEM